MDYPAMLNWLDQKGHFRIRPGLAGIRKVLAELDNPHKKLRVVLVGGTNGKGVCAHHLANLLAAHGCKVGLFSSPHLHSVRERISFNGVLVEPENLAEAFTRALEAGDKAKVELTYFEAITVCAILLFADWRVDWAVMEVGMGGSWDATNIVDCEAAIITTVGLDHTKQLGSTVGEIASTKADIIAPGCLAITGAKGDALEKIREKAGLVSATLLAEGREFGVKELGLLTKRGLPSGEKFRLKMAETKVGEFAVKLPGRHQGLLAGLALVTTRRLLGEDFQLGRAKEVLAGPPPPGRWELVKGEPPIILDGAHNRQALTALADLLKQIPAPVVAVVSQMEDKTADALLPLATIVGHFIACSVGGPRALSPAGLAERLRPMGVSFTTAASVEEALGRARKLATPRKGVVCVTGSFYLAARARENLGLPGSELATERAL